METKEIPKSGFSFENCPRNISLLSKGFVAPKAIKTGTTIAGVIFGGGVVLGADTRATEGPIVADKNCSKIHFLANNIYCCGAGTAADTEKTTELIASQLELLRLNTGREVPVSAACVLLKQLLFRYQGHVSAALVLGGVDMQGSHIRCIHPHGSSDKLPYVTMGSGCLASMAVFEARWKPDMNEEDAKKLVRDAIASGIYNDLGSGSNIDLCVIRRGSTEILRNYEILGKRGPKTLDYTYKLGTTRVLNTKIEVFESSEEAIPMEVA
ncbi:proteasome subunit beta type-7 [Teleopsis dalmanni]|uniref:proteasome subunit beta type-7 n=1 Tax=Teleopsis dalmanni TaxID=139649 RepID=UPI0018CCFB44|nr:proteasome subunit beta type-7 [Teleopsis dalmanni]